MHISEVILASLIVSSYSDDLSFKTNVILSRFQPHGYLLSPDFPQPTKRYAKSNITLYNIPDAFKVIRISTIRLEMQPPSAVCQILFLYVYTANGPKRRICEDRELIIGEQPEIDLRHVTFELITSGLSNIAFKIEFKFFKLLMSDGDMVKENNEGYIFGKGASSVHLVVRGFNPFTTISLRIHSEWPCFFYGAASVGDGYSQLTFDSNNLTKSQNITTQSEKLIIFSYASNQGSCLLLAYQVIDEGCSRNLDGNRMLDAIYKEEKLSYNIRCLQGYTLNRQGDDEIKCINHMWSNPGECVKHEEQKSMATSTDYQPALIGVSIALAITTCVVLVAIILLVKYRLMERYGVNQANQLSSNSGMLIPSVGDHSPKETDKLRSSAIHGSKNYQDPESAIMEDYYNANATMKHKDPRNDNYASITVETKKKKATVVVDTLVDNDIYEGDA